MGLGQGTRVLVLALPFDPGRIGPFVASVSSPVLCIHQEVISRGPSCMHIFWHSVHLYCTLVSLINVPTLTGWHKREMCSPIPSREFLLVAEHIFHS